jgi:uroporphyrinogen III methyltransferase/synthase
VGLITVRGADLLRQADVVVFDALANPDLLDLAPSDAKLIDAGKRAGEHKLTQDQTNALLAEHAAAGKRVVRLKGGDPYVFGRGSEEAMYLHERGIEVEVVPGITAAIAGPAAMGVPVTHRHVSATCTFITGHEDPLKGDTQVDYPALAALVQRGGTLCLYMAVGRLQAVVDTLVEHGCDLDTPAAIVQWGTLPRQRSLRSTLTALPGAIAREGISSPAIITIGPVAALDEPALNWFEQRPLFGQTIVITRTRSQASALRHRLAELGAEVIEAPTIRIEPPADVAPLEQAVASINTFDWLVLTSTNAVEAFASAMSRARRDSRSLGDVRIAAVGAATRQALHDHLRLVPDVTPETATAAALGKTLLGEHDMAGRRVLLPQGDLASSELANLLTEGGADVTTVEAYRNVPVDALPDELIERLADGRIDWLSFTSSSTVRNFVALLGDRVSLAGVKVASIGPMTSQAATDAGLTVTVEAAPHDIDGLVAVLVAAV